MRSAPNTDSIKEFSCNRVRNHEYSCARKTTHFQRCSPYIINNGTARNVAIEARFSNKPFTCSAIVRVVPSPVRSNAGTMQGKIGMMLVDKAVMVKTLAIRPHVSNAVQ